MSFTISVKGHRGILSGVVADDPDPSRVPFGPLSNVVHLPIDHQPLVAPAAVALHLLPSVHATCPPVDLLRGLRQLASTSHPRWPASTKGSGQPQTLTPGCSGREEKRWGVSGEVFILLWHPDEINRSSRPDPKTKVSEHQEVDESRCGDDKDVTPCPVAVCLCCSDGQAQQWVIDKDHCKQKPAGAQEVPRGANDQRPCTAHLRLKPTAGDWMAQLKTIL